MPSKIAVGFLLCGVPAAVLAQNARQEKTIRLPAGISVRAGSVSAAGTLVAAICSDRVVRIWSAQSGDLVHSFDASTGPATAVQFSGDGRLLAVAHEKGVINVFDVDSWKAQHDLTASSPMYALTFSPDNRRLVSGGDFSAQVWDLTSGKSLAEVSPPFGWSWAFSFSRDGRWLASADSDAFVRVYEASTGTLRVTVKEFLLEPTAVAFSTDGKSLLAGGVDKTISILDPESGKVLGAFPRQPGIVWSLEVSADGKQAAAVYRSAERFQDINQVTLWDLSKGTARADFKNPGVTIRGGAFVGDHYLFAAASANQLTLWSLR